MIFQLAAYFSGLAILLSFIPYIVGIFKHDTKPERMSWLLWTILGVISFFSQLAEGASYSLIMTAIQAIGDLVIFILAIKYGFGGLMKRDIVSFFGAFVALGLWYVTREPAVALFIVIFIDALGVVLTIIKTYQHPETETVSAWVLTLVAGLLASVAVAKIDIILLAFPMYIALASLSILVAIYGGFKKKRSV